MINFEAHGYDSLDRFAAVINGGIINAPFTIRVVQL